MSIKYKGKTISGHPGATFTPVVSDEGVLSWINDAELENPEPVDIKGIPGENGQDATINGQNAIEIVAGENVNIEQQDGIFTISATDGGSGFTPDNTLTLDDGTLGITTPVQGIYTQSEFNALTEEQKNKGMYVISDGAESSVSNTIYEVYSTEETIIGTWIDGKPLYQKSFNGTSPNSETGVIIKNAIENLSTAVYCEFSMYVKSYERFVCTSGWASQAILLCVSTTGDIQAVGCASAYRNIPMIITVKYTKTTD